eukprot:g2518.t1
MHEPVSQCSFLLIVRVFYVAMSRSVDFRNRARALLRSSRAHEAAGGAYLFQLLATAGPKAFEALDELMRGVDKLAASGSLEGMPGHLIAARAVLLQTKQLPAKVITKVWQCGKMCLEMSLRVVASAEDEALEEPNGTGTYVADPVLMTTDCRGRVSLPGLGERNDEDGLVDLDRQQRKILSAWLTTKDSAALLASVLSMRARDNDNQVMRDIGNLMIRAILRAKHHGAVSKTAEALEIVGRHLAECDDPVLSSLPLRKLSKRF